MSSRRPPRRQEGAGSRSVPRAEAGQENLCRYGTPLPPLDTKADHVNEYKPEWQQEVYDQQGRRRFHGAFTGGWSAGYYNTVGSKEGWTPSSFRSSRKGKASSPKDGPTGTDQGTAARQQTVEDFMDEEDLASLREGRGAIQSSNLYADSLAGSRRERDPITGEHYRTGPEGDEPATASAASTIAVRARSLGIQLLQRMGWKPGQGLGAWITVEARKRWRLMLKLPLEDDDKLEKDGNGRVPPLDTPLVQPVATQNTRFGLGWQAEQTANVPLAELLQRRHASQTPDAGSKRGGFGIGALEEDSDDEQDVYSTGLAVDDSTLAPRQRAQAKKPFNGTTGRAIPEGDKNDGLAGEDAQRWADGTPMIAGFRLAATLPEEVPVSELPAIPSDWHPDPQRVWARSDSGTAPPMISVNRTQIDAKTRASLLGAAPMPGPPPLLSNYISTQQRAVPGHDDKIEETASPVRPSIPTLLPSVAAAALQGFIPFENEPAKQARYLAYLRRQAYPHGSDADVPLTPAQGQSQMDVDHELREFSRSASIFKPLHTIMASRFESSLPSRANADALPTGLHYPKGKDMATPAATVEATIDVGEHDDEFLTPWQRNARMGHFGPGKTRHTTKWKPTRLLCKRFGVPSPYPNEDDEPEGSTEDQGATEAFDPFGQGDGHRKRPTANVNARWEVSKRQLQSLAAARQQEGQSSANVELDADEDSEEMEGMDSGAQSAARDLANVGLGDVAESAQAEEVSRPPMEVFRAIFGEEPAPEPQEVHVDRDDSRPDEKMAEDKASQVPPRVLFKPRTRDNDTQRQSMPNQPGTRKQLASKKRPSSGKQTRGRLTFVMDDDEEDDEMSDLPSAKRRSVRNASQAPDSESQRPPPPPVKQRLHAVNLWDNVK